MKIENTSIATQLRPFVAVCLFLLSFLFHLSYTYANGVWDGGGDGTSWEDGDNWGDNNVPNGGDDVTLPNGASVTISSAGQLAKSVTIDAGAALSINASGVLIIGTSQFEAMVVNGQFSNLGTLNVNGPGRDGLQIGANASASNGGQILISNTKGQGIELKNGATLTNQVNGRINIFLTFVEGILLTGGGANVQNYGWISIDDTKQEGIEVEDGSAFLNYPASYLAIGNTTFEAIENDGTFINRGNIVVTGGRDINEGVTNGVGDTFVNEGLINISGVNDSGIRNQGSFTNNGRIDVGSIGTNLNNDFAVEQQAQGFILNDTCGILNITSQHAISIIGSSNITNDGIITSVFTGSNKMSGSAAFINNAVISATGGVFNLMGGSLTGSGTVNAGPIPATVPLAAGCSPIAPPVGAPVPTMGEWALILLALSLLAFATLFMGRAQMAFAGAQSIALPGFTLVWDKPVFGKVYLATLMLTGFGLSLGWLLTGEVAMADLAGSLLAGPVFAYLIHLMMLFGRK